MPFFNDPTTGQPADNTQNQNEDYLTKVVSEKGEQWKDPEVLAKGYAHAQDLIKQLEQTQEELKKDLGEKNYTEKLLEELRKGQGTPPSGEPSAVDGGTTPDGPTGQVVSEDMLKGLIEQTLTQREASNTAKQNLDAANAKLEQLYGTEVERVVGERAAEIGMNKEQLAEIAAQSPNAFLKLIGEQPVKEHNPTRTGSVNTSAEAFHAPSQKDWSYYQKMRRENPNEYYSAKTQREILKARKEMGSNFGN